MVKKLLAAGVMAMVSVASNAALISMYDTDTYMYNEASAQAIIDASSGPDLQVNSDILNFHGSSFPGDFEDRFVMTVSGTLNTDAYDYLSLYHDDGFRLYLNGNLFMGYNGNTAPRWTSRFLGDFGVVDFDMIYWDQGGYQVARLLGGSGLKVSHAKIGDRKIVPEPGTLALFGIGLVGLGLTRRKTSA